MNIRSRIALLVVLSFLAILCIGGYAIITSRHNAAEVRSVTEGVVPSTLASADLVAQAKDVQLDTLAMVTAPTNDVARQLREQLSTRRITLLTGLQQQLAAATNDTQRGQIRQARESLGNYFQSISETADLKLSGNQPLAEANLFATVAQYQREFGQILEALRVEKNRSKDAAIASLKNRLSETASTLSIATVIVMLTLSGLGWLLYRQVVIPIGRMQTEMSAIAESQDFTRRVPVTRNDEIGRSITAFNSMIAKIEENSAQLRQKNSDIQTMLQNIPQGILTIRPDGTVHHEYSTYLEKILDTTDIAGRGVLELVFAHTSLGADALSQVDAAIGACIGEDVMNFEFNRHLLVGEVEKKMPDGSTRALDLVWSPIVDDYDIVVRLMLCVRDVTELRKLAAETADQRLELETIGEILGVTQEKFQEFIASALRFIEENGTLIRQHPKHDPEVVGQLFRNMHTIKGNARTYGLRHLTDRIHEAEQTYDALRQTPPGVAWDAQQLLRELGDVRARVERYASINDETLGRKGPGRRGNDRYLMVDRQQIQETLQRLEAVNIANIHELVAARSAVQQKLRLLGTEPLHEILGSIIESLPSLAHDLDREAPRVIIEDNGFVIRNQAASLLKNVFMHLLRNAMDHGIEPAAERMADGKDAAGTIRLSVTRVKDQLQLILGDDGRGLSLARIRSRAVQSGLLADGQIVTDEELARQIFRPGFSTAEKVTSVSGRGVGMDAVQDFLRRESGRIAIRFTDGEEGATWRHFETVVSLPASFAEQVASNATPISIDTAKLTPQGKRPPHLHAV